MRKKCAFYAHGRYTLLKCNYTLFHLRLKQKKKQKKKVVRERPFCIKLQEVLLPKLQTTASLKLFPGSNKPYKPSPQVAENFIAISVGKLNLLYAPKQNLGPTDVPYICVLYYCTHLSTKIFQNENWEVLVSVSVWVCIHVYVCIINIFSTFIWIC